MITPLGILAVSDLVLPIRIVIPILTDYATRLRAQLSASLSITAPAIHFDFGLALKAMAAIMARIRLGLALELPHIHFSISAALQVQLRLVLDLLDLMAKASIGGLYAYAYNGPVNAMGGELASRLQQDAAALTPTQQAQGLILVVKDPAAWAVLRKFLKVEV